MKKTTIGYIFALTSSCLLSVLGQVQAQEQAQEQEAGDEMDFSADSFDLAPAAPPAPVYDSFVEGGVGYTSDDSFRFGRYNGLIDEGTFVNGSFRYLQRGEWDEGDLSYIEARGDDLGLDNRSLEIEGGSQGKYELFLHYDEIPFYDFRSQTPYRGVGSGNLFLPSNWESNPQQDFNTATQNFPELNSSLKSVDMETERTSFGGGVRWHINPKWTARVSAESEKKEGLKPLGVAWGTSGQNSVAVVVPQTVDYKTDQLDAEVGFQDRRMQFRLAYQLSQFNNQENSLLVQNPFTYAGWPPASYPDGVAEVDLPPDNTAHTINISGGYRLTDTTRLTANVGYSVHKQDESLLPYTANPALTVSQGLPRNSVDAEVTNLLGNFELYGRPTKELDYKLRYRYTDRDNDTSRDMYIYVTGDSENQQTGYPESNYRYNSPYSSTEHLLGGDLGYRLQRDTKLSLGYEYRDIERTYSERTDNDQHTGSINLRHRFNRGLSGSVDYARTWRNGSTYDGRSTLLDSYTQTYVDSLGDADFINHPELRMYHLADLVRDKVSARLTYVATEALTLGGRLSYNQDDYDESTLGLTGVEGAGLSLDGSYRISEGLTMTGFYAYDNRSTDQAGWSFGGYSSQLPQSQDPERRWWVNNEYDINTVGAGLDWQATPKIRLSADYVYSDAVTETDSRSGDELETGPYPDITNRTHSLRSELDYDLSDRTTLGLTYIYEKYQASDWQTDDVAPDTIGRVLSLEAIDPDYDNHLIMAWGRYNF